MKFILGIITFILTFGLSVSLVGLLFGFPKADVSSQVYQLRTNNSVAKYKISSLLRRDVRYGHWRNYKIKKIEGYYSMSEAELYNNDVYRKTINDYVTKSASMNDSNLPDDFKYAWRKHMQAWQKQANYLNTNSYDGDSHYISYSDNTSEINETWFQVLRIAERYGVEIPSSYYR